MKTAHISSCNLYRYELGRILNPVREPRRCLFVMLNPSTADAEQDDRTISRCVDFAGDWGYDALTVGNLYAYRATKPAVLATVTDPVGPDNDRHLERLAGEAALIVAAWGDDVAQDRADRVLALLRRYQPVHALRLSKQKQPRHPLYVRRDARPVLLP